MDRESKQIYSIKVWFNIDMKMNRAIHTGVKNVRSRSH